MKTKLFLHFNNFYLKKSFLFIFITMFFIGCNSSDHQTPPLITQGQSNVSEGNKGLLGQKTTEVAESTIESDILEIEASLPSVEEYTQACVAIYEINTHVPQMERETTLIDCIISEISHELREDYPYALVNLKLKGNIDIGNGDKSKKDLGLGERITVDSMAAFDGVIPLASSKTETLIFQLGIEIYLYFSNFNHDEGAKKLSVLHGDAMESLNSGLMYRISIGEGVVGINLFYDNKRKTGHHRVSAGFDYSNGYNTFSLNLYHPLSGWISVNDYYEERAIGGFDLLYERTINKATSFHVGGELFFTTHDFSNIDGNANNTVQAAIGLGLSINFTCDTKGSLDINLEKDGMNFNLNNLGLGLSLGLEQRIGRKRDCSSIQANRFRAARRDRRIPVAIKE